MISYQTSYTVSGEKQMNRNAKRNMIQNKLQMVCMMYYV